MKKNTPTPELDIKNLTSLTIKESMREALPAPAGGKIDIPSLDRIEQPVASHVHGLGVKATGDKKSGEVTQSIVLSLRSPEGVLYYLGQLMRVEQHAGLIPTMARRDENGKYTLVPLFVAFPPYGTDDNGNPFPECKQRSVSVTDGEGELYIVPRAPEQSWTDLSMEELKPGNYYSTLDSCNSGESMRVLGVLTQLIGLQKAAQDFPPTTTVRAVGQ